MSDLRNVGFKEKRNIFLSYCSGYFWGEISRKTKQKEKFLSAHYYDPITSELLFLNLGYRKGKLNNVLIFISSNIGWHLIKDVLKEMDLFNEFEQSNTIDKIQSCLFPSSIKIK